ncbi:hypothetical protein RRG08_032358 [Elysia crispata]|uniref:Transmembrane protein 26 n=1 Tax=Elysia crispata TaxID=231223 RepID=A0AAE1AGV5_9GAST|nr:hypothetical protein RRG08_032358 [Elysia crispata]
MIITLISLANVAVNQEPLDRDDTRERVSLFCVPQLTNRLTINGDKDFWIYMRPLQISSRLLNKQYSSFSFHAQPGPQIRVILGGLTLRGQGVLNSSDQPGNWEELHCTGTSASNTGAYLDRMSGHNEALQGLAADGSAGNVSISYPGGEAIKSEGAVSGGNTDRIPGGGHDKDVNKSLQHKLQENEIKSFQSLPRSETSHGKKRVIVTNGSSEHPSIKHGEYTGSQNLSGFNIRIGGRTYTYRDNADPKASSPPSETSFPPSYQPSVFTGTAYGHRPAVPLSHGVYYIPSEKPFLGLQTIRALNSTHSLARDQSSYPHGLFALTHGAQHRSNMKSSTLAGDLCQVFSVFFAILVRVILAVFSILTVLVVVRERNDQRFWALTSILTLLLIESVYTVVKRRGQERKWISLCFVCYLLACLPSVWLLELQKLGLFTSKYANASGETSELNLPGGLTTEFVLASDDRIYIVENCLVFLLILCRWLLPRGDISRDQLSQLLFVFIGMGSDVMELFQLFEQEEVKRRRTLTYVILTVYSLSLFQFTLVLTMSANPKKARVALDSAADTSGPARLDLASRGLVGHTGPRGRGGHVRQKRTFSDFLIRSEIWSLIVTILMQDGPYLAVRLYVVVKLKIIKSNIIFFVCKNAIVVCLLIYRLIVVGIRMNEDVDDDSDDGMDLFYKEYVMTHNHRGSRWSERRTRASSASGRSVNSAVTTMTPASTNTRQARQKTAESADANPVNGNSALSSEEVGAVTNDSAHSTADENPASNDSALSSKETGAVTNDSAHSTADENPDRNDSSLSTADENPVRNDSAHSSKQAGVVTFIDEKDPGDTDSAPSTEDEVHVSFEPASSKN